MANLGPQHINLSYSGLLQVPNGITSVLQTVSDGNGNATGLQLSSTAIGGIVTATSLTVTGVTTLSTSLSGILKATSGVVSVASAGSDYVSPAVLGQPNGVATLDSAGQLPASQLPPIAVVQYLGAVASQSAMLALTGQQGDWCTRTDLGTNWVITGSNPSVLSSWTQLTYPTAPVTSVNGLTGAVSLTYTNVGAAPATTGNSILYANGLGGFSNVTIGSNLTFAGGTLSATGSAGTVTSFSFTNGNGLTGTVTNATTTPTLSLGTSVTGVLKGNGTAISAAVSGTDYAPATSGTSILKGNGSGGFASAVVGTDYAPATTGTDILYGNGLGGFSGVTIGSGLTFAGGTLSSVSGGGGTVTNVSVVTANGFAGTVANPSTLPAITLSTSVTGLLKGNGTAISAATAGTDYAAATTGTNAQLLANDGAGGFSNVTVGTGLSYSAGTLSATGGGGSVTSVTASSPLASSGGTAPNITIQQASSTQAGFLSSADWSTFNSKAASGANSDITSMSGLTGGLSLVDHIDFNTTTATTSALGRAYWDGGTTLNLGMTANVTQKVGESEFMYVKASSAITKGQLCMFTGAVGASDVVTAAPATGISVSQYVIGIAAESIALNGFGLIQTFGTLKGFDTSGSSVGETWADGDVLYYNSAYTGGLTKVYPSSGPIVVVCAVTHATGGSSGSVTVRVTFTQRITATSPLASSQTTSGAALSISQATGSTSGYLSSTDWTTFNSKAPATSGTSILYGNGSGGFSNVTVGSGLSFAAGTLSASGGGSVTITNDTTTSTFEYPLFAAATSGTVSTVYTSNTNYLYKPSTGELQAPEVIASNGLVVNSATVSTSYAIPSGSNAMSAGPVTVASGQTVTVQSGSTWVVV